MSYLNALGFVALLAVSLFFWLLTIGGLFKWKDKGLSVSEGIVWWVVLAIAIISTAGWITSTAGWMVLA